MLTNYNEPVILVKEETTMFQSKLSTDKLINQIIDKHHYQEKQLVREIDILLNRILLAHYHHDKELMSFLHKSFSELKMELEQLLAKEEKEYFINMMNATIEGNNVIRINIREMKASQKRIEAIMNRIRQKTNNFSVPEYACSTFAKAYKQIKKLADNLDEHFAKENNVLLPRFQ